METVVGVRFKQAGKIYYFSPGGKELALHDHVIVETARGMEYGTIVIAPREVCEKKVVKPLKEVIRKATEADEKTNAENKEKEKKAFDICLE